jgi:GH24 family phage-related lysozyme (muramidase)
MPLLEDYIKRIKGLEGFTPKAQWDYKQYSGGYGTRAQPGQTFTPETADAALRSELEKAGGYVSGLGVQMTPQQEAALTSLTFNAGPGWMNSGLGQAVKSGDWDTAKQRFAQYNRAGGQFNQGLANRRAQELAWLDEAAPSAPGPVNVAQNGAINSQPFAPPMALGGPKPQDTAMASGNGILSKKIDPQEELMGILGNQGSQAGWNALMQMGAGLAAGAHKGWGAGIGLGLSGASDALQGGQNTRMKGMGMLADMQAQQERLKLAQAEAAKGPAPTELVRNYQAALQQGFQGNLVDFQRAMRAASPDNVPAGYKRNPEGGLAFEPGGPADPAIIKEQSLARGGRADVPQAVRTEAIKADQAYTNITKSLDDYAATVEKTGNVFLPGEDKDAVSRKRRNIQLQLKELYNLGVLNGPDLQLMDNMLFDPSASLNPFGGNFGFNVNVAGRTRKSVDDLKEILRGIRNSKTQAIGLPEIPGAADTAGATPADALKAKYGLE